MTWILRPFYQFADWLLGWYVWWGIKKWVRTPHLFDTAINPETIRFYLRELLITLEAEREILADMLELVRKLKGVHYD